MLRMDLSPLRGAADFRWLLCSRTFTLLGAEASEVALLVQARQLTGSAFAVGLLGGADHHLGRDAAPVGAFAADQPGLHAGHRQAGHGEPLSGILAPGPMPSTTTSTS